MKKLIILSVFVSYQMASAQFNLVVKGNGTSNNAGTYRCLIFKGAKGFPKDPSQAVQFDNGTIAAKTGTCVFENLATGTYAVSTFHDKNNNSELDTGLFGAPKEKYGFSNDASKPFAPPDFEEAAFTLKANSQINIKLK
jgi:uncharacterized protein (DUF2141 family)